MDKPRNNAPALAGVKGYERPRVGRGHAARTRAITPCSVLAMVVLPVVVGCGDGEPSSLEPSLTPRDGSGPGPQASGAGGSEDRDPSPADPGAPGGPDPDVVKAPDDKGAPTTPDPDGPDGVDAEAGWCRAKRVLQGSCGNCHGAELAFGAPMPLVTHEDLMAPAPSDGREAFKLVAERIEDTVRPMPPSPNPPLSDVDREAIATWAAEGAPFAECGDAEEPPPPVGDPSCIDCGDYTCGDGTPLRFQAHGQAIAGDETPYDASEIGGAATLGDPNLYECFFFKAPWGEGAQATGFKPIIDNKRIAHHWLLYASENAPFDIVDGGMRGECQLQSDPNRVLLAGWAPGTPGRNFPDDVGQELPFGPNTYITLEMHYYNTMPGMAAPDRTGAELCLASEPRANVATQHWLGTENINVPAGASGDASDVCTPTLGANETATLLAVTPHMHALGTHAKLEILRGDGRVEVIHDGGFSADNQTTYLFDPPITINADDQLRTTCTFQNNTAAPVAFGEGSQEEMCYIYTTAYPAGALHNGKTGCFGPFCTPGGIRRCIDNEQLGHILGGL